MSVSERPAHGGPQSLFYSTAITEGIPRMVRGEGIYFWDENGKRYTDVASGTFLTNLGQGNERVLRAMYDQGRKLTFSYVRNTRHDANEELTERVARLAGPGFERVHLSSGGSEANEMAIKFLRQYAVATGHPERTRVISLMPSYHGATFGAIAMNGDLDAPALFGPFATFSEKVPAPLTYRSESPEAAARITAKALSETIERLGGETVLAFVCEPVGGQSSGANVPHPLFFAEVRRICDQHGIRVIYDEIMSAVRSGKFLAAHFQPDALPDLVVMAKGLGAGYAPLGAVLAPASMVDELAGLTGFNVSHTFNANPICCAAGVAVIDEVVDRDLMGNAERMGEYLRAGLERLKERSPLIGDVRGRGLLNAIELVADRDTMATFGPGVDPGDRLRVHATKHGILLYARRQNGGRFGDWSVIAPPLIVTEAEIDEIVEGIGLAVDDATAELLG
jgi:adenosylmethionine-8-amino-7-oxononanoate aminotransferase